MEDLLKQKEMGEYRKEKNGQFLPRKSKVVDIDSADRHKFEVRTIMNLN